MTMFYAWIIFWLLVIIVATLGVLAVFDKKLNSIKDKLRRIEDKLSKWD